MPALRIDRRSIPRDRSGHFRIRRGAGRKLDRGRNQSHAEPDATNDAHHQWRGIASRASQPDDKEQKHGWRPAHLRAFAGIGAMSVMAESALSADRTPGSRIER